LLLVFQVLQLVLVDLPLQYFQQLQVFLLIQDSLMDLLDRDCHLALQVQLGQHFLEILVNQLHH
jgi:hypothetical protein